MPAKKTPTSSAPKLIEKFFSLNDDFELDPISHGEVRSTLDDGNRVIRVIVDGSIIKLSFVDEDDEEFSDHEE